MKFISYIYIRFASFAFALLPYPLLNLKSFSLYLLLRYIIRYRRSVILSNIAFCFPEMSASDKEHTIKQFYISLADIICESLKSYGMKQALPIEKAKVENPDILAEAYDRGESVVLFSQHCGNWEWGCFSLASQLQHRCNIIIKPLSNNYINSFVNQRRASAGSDISSSLREFSQIAKKDAANVFIFLNDQYPAHVSRLSHVNFFNREVAFNKSAADFAKLHNLSCYTLSVYRTKRNHYKMLIEKIPDEYSADQIVQEYASTLERNIRQQPHIWLWSHKRFKDTIRYA